MKTITMMQLRKSPGEYAFRVRADGESFLVTYQGKPCFKMVPIEDMIVVRSDGTFKGPKPLTMGLDLGSEYADKTVDLADVFGYGPSAPGWLEPSNRPLDIP